MNLTNQFSHFETNAQHMLNVYLEFIFKKVPNYFPDWLFSSIQLVMSAPGSRRKKQWPHRKLACGCPGVSGKGVGWWWPAAGLGAWTVAIHAWDLLREVTIIFIQFSSVQSLSHVWFFVTPWTAARQAFLSTTNSQSSPKLMSMSQRCHPSIHCLHHSLLLSHFSHVRLSATP